MTQGQGDNSFEDIDRLHYITWHILEGSEGPGEQIYEMKGPFASVQSSPAGCQSFMLGSTSLESRVRSHH